MSQGIDCISCIFISFYFFWMPGEGRGALGGHCPQLENLHGFAPVKKVALEIEIIKESF